MKRTPVAQLLRVASLALLTVVAFGASWALASDATRGAAAQPASDVARVTPVSRSLPREVPPVAPAQLRLIAPTVPLTLIDAGAVTPLRAPRAVTVADALAVNGIEVGPQDRLSSAPDAIVNAGDVIQLVRVADQDIVVREALAFPVMVIQDPELLVGRAVVVIAGVPGLADNTYRIHMADGAEEARTLVSSVEVVTPVAEVRRVGTRPAPPPPAPGDIESIIRDAAAIWGADPSQLLRVAWCESRYNPLAYNARSGASGLFQFMPATWAANSVRAGYGGASVFDAVASANVAAYMFHNGQAGQWSCK
ncbi:MAG TPA: G5 domain-containing protein [Candidatus Limnocylindria bacterium]|nr:G5 domain-containing protein [Candidatus Limnocylindria bacterium]